MQPVFIWTDIGTNPDDTLALLMALRSPELAILGIATCDDPEGFRAQLLKTILEVEGKNSIPIGQGGCKPFSDGVLKREYLGPKFPFRDSFLTGDRLLKNIFQNQAGVSVITLGPLSDFTSILHENPDLIGKINSWTALGGSLDGEEEYNFCLDPQATQFLLKQPFPKRLIPIDLARQFFLKEEDFARIRFPLALKDYFLNQWRTWKTCFGREKLYLNDPLAIACFLNLESFSYKRVEMILKEVKRGWQVWANDQPDSNLEVAVGVDRGAFFEIFWELLG